MLSSASSSWLAFAIVGCGSVWGSSGHRSLHGNHHIHLKREDTTQLFNLTGVEGLSGLSASCIQAMESPVACPDDAMLLLVQGSVSSGIAASELLTADDLATMCTASCSSSLASLSQTVDSACANDALVIPPSNSTVYLPGTDTQESVFGGRNETYRPSYTVDKMVLNYKLGCLQDSALSGSDAWCYLRISQGLTDTCDDCDLGSWRAQMENPDSYDPDLAAQYTSQVSSCGKSLTPIATPTKTNLISSATATATQACSGTMVPVSADTNCDDFARANSIGTEQLLSLNGLTSGCVDFPGSKTSLCVEGSCETYTVAENDTCSSIVKAAGIAPVQFITWNPTLSTLGCSSDIAKMVGHVVCIGNPLDYTPPDITGSDPTTSSAPTKTPDVDFSDLEDLTTIWTHDPLPTATPTSTGPPPPWITPTYDLAEGSVTDCYYTYDNQIANMSCYTIAARYGVDVATWVNWNPSTLKGNLSEPGNCWLDAGTRYCGLFWNPLLASPQNTTEDDYAPKPSDATAGATDKCFVWDKTPATSEDGLCTSFMEEWGITIDEFYYWNPAVGADCSNLWLNTSYCVSADDPPASSSTTSAPTSTATGGAPAPTRTGTVAGCQKWYVAQTGDSCSDVATANGITLAQFVSWNTDVDPSNCDGFWPSYAYCVEGPESTTTTPTPTPTSGGAPAPTRPGTVAGCQEWYVTQSGDGCGNVATEYGITISQFVAWNTDVDPTTCDGFWPAYAYCVKGPTSSATPTSTKPTGVTPPGPTQAGIPSNCNKYAIAQSGDGCELFAQRNGITASQLYAWNPVLGTTCVNFWLGEAYCIGLSS